MCCCSGGGTGDDVCCCGGVEGGVGTVTWGCDDVDGWEFTGAGDLIAVNPNLKIKIFLI